MTEPVIWAERRRTVEGGWRSGWPGGCGKFIWVYYYAFGGTREIGSLVHACLVSQSWPIAGPGIGWWAGSRGVGNVQGELY